MGVREKSKGSRQVWEGRCGCGIEKNEEAANERK